MNTTTAGRCNVYYRSVNGSVFTADFTDLNLY